MQINLEEKLRLQMQEWTLAPLCLDVLPPGRHTNPHTGLTNLLHCPALLCAQHFFHVDNKWGRLDQFDRVIDRVQIFSYKGIIH